jgi:hypothetical protein
MVGAVTDSGAPAWSDIVACDCNEITVPLIVIPVLSIVSEFDPTDSVIDCPAVSVLLPAETVIE